LEVKKSNGNGKPQQYEPLLWHTSIVTTHIWQQNPIIIYVTPGSRKTKQVWGSKTIEIHPNLHLILD